MKTHRQRRREKRRARLVRTRSEAKKAGGFGGIGAQRALLGDWGRSLSRGDLVALRHAINTDRHIPADKRHEFMRLVEQTFTAAKQDDRLALSVATTVIAMVASDQRRRDRIIRDLLRRTPHAVGGTPMQSGAGSAQVTP